MLKKTNDNKQKSIINKPSVFYKENADGVTLIALVITIIILLILAGISISTLFGDNGVIFKTENSKEVYEVGQYRDIIQVTKEAANSKKLKGDENFFENIQNELKQQDGIKKSNITGTNEEIFIETDEEYKFKLTENALNLIATNQIWFDLENSLKEWDDETGETTVLIKATGSYNIQYKINDSEDWSEPNQSNELTINNIKNRDIIYARTVDEKGRTGVEIDLNVERIGDLELIVKKNGHEVNRYYGKPGEKKSFTLYVDEKFTLSYRTNDREKIEELSDLEIVSKLNEEQSTETFSKISKTKLPYTYIYTFGTQDDELDFTTTLNDTFTVRDTTQKRKDENIGYEFKGWEDKYHKEYTPGQPITPGNNLTLFEVWEANKYNLTLDANGGIFEETDGWTIDNDRQPATAKKTIIYDEKYGTFPTAKLTGYTNIGWKDESGNAINSMTTVKTLTDQTFSAQWAENTYTIKFNSNGGSGTMSDLNLRYTESKNLTKNSFKRTGYVFIGWATTSTGNVKYTNGASVNKLTSTANGTITLYAKWKEIKSVTKWIPFNKATRDLKDDIGGITDGTLFNWSSGTPSVATVNEKGELTQVKAGYSKITVTDKNDPTTVVECNIYIYNAEIKNTSIKWNTYPGYSGGISKLIYGADAFILEQCTVSGYEKRYKILYCQGKVASNTSRVNRWVILSSTNPEVKYWIRYNLPLN